MTKSSVASKLAEASHPVAVPPQWLPVLLAQQDPCLDNGMGDSGERASLELARSTGSHCGGQTTGCSTSASLLAMQGFVVFGMKAAQKAATMQMRTSARELNACFFAYKC